MELTNSYAIKIKHFNHIFSDTLKIYNDAVRYFLKVIEKEWVVVEPLKNLEAQSYIEALSHKTKNRSVPKYDFDSRFPKMPSYLRRSAIT